MGKEINATLGGRNYTIPALPIGPSRIWRQKVGKEFDQIINTFNLKFNFDTNNIGQLTTIIKVIASILKTASDRVINLLFEYSPALMADKEWIEANATDDEALALFQEVLKLAFPFGVLLDLATGRMGSKTSLSLPSPNGESPPHQSSNGKVVPLPASGPVKKTKK